MAQSLGATRLIDHPERLTSNWLVFRRLPRLVRYCEPRGFLNRPLSKQEAAPVACHTFQRWRSDIRQPGQRWFDRSEHARSHYL